MTFGDFGAPVSVAAPPASEVYAPASIHMSVSPGP
jgi:hypothetical protein